MTEHGNPLMASVAIGAMGVWWVLSPNSVIRLHRSLGSRTSERLGPGVVKGLGVLIFVMAAMGGLAFALKG